MRIIDADALKKTLHNFFAGKVINEPTYILRDVFYHIDSAPELGYEDGVLLVENATRRAIELEEAYNNGWSDGFSEGEKERTDEIGKWIFHKDYNESCRYGCNQCGNLNNIPHNYCPNCGVKMKKGD